MKHPLPGTENVTVSRATASARRLGVLLIGNSRLSSDIELLLENKWSGLKLATTPSEVTQFAREGAPKVIIAEHDCLGGQELRVLESQLRHLPKRVLLVTDDISSAVRQMSCRRAAVHGIHVLEVSASPSEAAEAINSFLDGVVDMGVGETTPSIDRLKAANHGFLAASSKDGRSWEHGRSRILVELSRQLLSRFSLSPDVAVASLVLAELFDFLRATEGNLGEDLQKDIELLRAHADSDGVPTTKLVELASHAREYMRQGGCLPQAEWEKALTNLGLGRLAQRHLARAYGEFAEFCKKLSLDDAHSPTLTTRETA